MFRISGRLYEAFFKDGSHYGENIRYSLETAPFGTVGPLRIFKDLEESMEIN